MFGTLFGLFFIHGQQREVEREKRMQYWREQVRMTGCTFSNKLTVFADCIPTDDLAGERNRLSVSRISRFRERTW